MSGVSCRGGCDLLQDIKCSGGSSGIQSPDPDLPTPLQLPPTENPFSPWLTLLLLFIWMCSLVFFEIIFLWLLPIYPCFLHASAFLFFSVLYTFFILLIFYPFPSNHFPLNLGTSSPHIINNIRYRQSILSTILPTFKKLSMREVRQQLQGPTTSGSRIQSRNSLNSYISITSSSELSSHIPWP